MPDLTALLSLLKPAGGEVVSVASFNTNSDILDNAVLLTNTQTLTNKTLTAPTMSAPVITGGTTVTGGVVVSNGGLRVTAGNISVGTTPGTNIALRIDSITLAGANQYGVYSAPTVSSAATNGHGMGISVTVATSASLTDLYGILIQPPFMTGTATALNAYGIYVGSPQSAGTDRNIGVFVAEPTGGTETVGLWVDGGGIIIDGTAPSRASKLGLGGSISTSATLGSNGTLPAQVAGYLVGTWDENPIRIPFYNA